MSERNLAERLSVVRPRMQPPRPKAVRLLSTMFAASFVALLVILAATSAPPSGIMLLVLLAFAVMATHRETVFGDETAMSGSIVVIVASIVAFQSGAAVLGPVLCSAVAGIHWAQVRDRSWSKVVVNSSATGLAAAAGAALFAATRFQESAWSLIAASFAAILAYWLVNNILIGVVLAVVSGDRLSAKVLDLIRSETEMLLFALAGALCGLLFFEVGTWAGAVALAMVLVAVDVMVISRPHPYSVRMRHPGLPATVGRAVACAAGVSAAYAATRWITVFVGVPIGVTVTLALATVVALGLLRHRVHAWDVSLAAGVALADAPYALVAGCAGAVAAAVGMSMGAIVAAIGLVLATWMVSLRQRRAVDASAEADRVHAIVERALLDAPQTSSR
jgi:hypothetical protein